MPRRVVIALLQPVRWHPPGVDPAAWRRALAEDVVDLIATLSEVDAAIAVPAADRGLAEAVAWPGMPVYGVAVPTLAQVLAVAAAHGYDQAAVLAPDAPDLPALLVGKLMRPLGSRSVAVAPAAPDRGGPGLLGLACRLPVPDWFPDIDLDSGTVAAVRAAAPGSDEVSSTPAWRRLRDATGFATLDPAVEGWETTRALLTP